MRIKCPCCGLRDHSEFSYGGDAMRLRPSINDTELDNWSDYVFLRKNIRGLHKEFWQHIYGCRQWLIVERDTVSHHISSVSIAKKSNQLAASNKGIKDA